MTPHVKKSLKVAGSAILVLLAVYIAAYITLSVRGSYEPAAVGTNGVKSYGWIPDSFTQKGGQWNRPVVYLFLPLFLTDVRFWHTSDWNDVMKYPKQKWNILPANVTEKQITGGYWVEEYRGSAYLYELEIREHHSYRRDCNFETYEKPSLQTGYWALEGDRIILNRNKPYREYNQDYNVIGSKWHPVMGQFFIVQDELVLLLPVPVKAHIPCYFERGYFYTFRKAYQPKLLKPGPSR